MTEAQPAAKPTRGKYVGAGIAIAVVGAIVTIWFSGLAASPNIGTLSVLKTQYKQPLTTDHVSINAGTYNYVQFSVPNGATDAVVTGKFMANGGSGNEIVVAILSQDDFVNWQNHNPISPYYISGKVSFATVDASVPTGQTLYLVFDNTFSSISNKNVSTNLQLSYKW